MQHKESTSTVERPTKTTTRRDVASKPLLPKCDFRFATTKNCEWLIDRQRAAARRRGGGRVARRAAAGRARAARAAGAGAHPAGRARARRRGGRQWRRYHRAAHQLIAASHRRALVGGEWRRRHADGLVARGGEPPRLSVDRGDIYFRYPVRPFKIRNLRPVLPPLCARRSRQCLPCCLNQCECDGAE